MTILIKYKDAFIISSQEIQFSCYLMTLKFRIINVIKRNISLVQSIMHAHYFILLQFHVP